MNSHFKPCALVPVYNHGSTARDVVHKIISFGLEVILVDDGSGEDTKLQLQNIDNEFEECTLYRLYKNQGKGGAVIHGLTEAEKAGYTHALQIDADGQHDLEQIRTFIECSSHNPNHLICGHPVYDDSVPSSREQGRKITTFWVALETLSRDIEDAMCGFRVYPLQATSRLFRRSRLGKRMEFDIEILVKLHWMNVKMIFLPIRVIYPEDGTSNFRMFHDNVAISLAHTRLFIGMLFRSPFILFNKMTS